jgi:UDP-N-acetylglucosamine 4,6-dehydratase
MDLTDASILVTGGTGAFGRAFVAHALTAGARRVAIYSRSESKQAELHAAIADPRLRCFIGDVRDLARLEDAMRGVSIVVHAAALKRVDTCEADPVEAVKTNVYGTECVARAAMRAGVARAVLLSTDKAVEPSTTYGATKLAAERLWNGMNVYSAGTPTRFAVTRYGNVLGSTGSVLPIWRAQIARGAPITITHPGCTRFWMSMASAIDVVRFALAHMRGGEVYVPLLRAARLDALAAVVAPGHPMTIVGLGQGEKPDETLISEHESLSATKAGDLAGTPIMVLAPSPHRGPRFVLSADKYGSATAQRFTADELRALVEAA